MHQGMSVLKILIDSRASMVHQNYQKILQNPGGICKYSSGSASPTNKNANSEIISTNCVSTMSANLISQDLLSQCREMTRFVGF